MAETMTYTGTLVVEECWCGILHAIPSQLQAAARDKGQGVHCPLGHRWVYKGKTTEEKLAAANRRVQAQQDLLVHETRSHAATRGHLTRQRKRAAAGVCPCCKRTFRELARHMKTKHPAYVAEHGGKS